MDEGKGRGMRRIFAWIGILLFFLLIVNIFTIQFQIEISIGVYIFLIILYLFVMRKNDGPQDGKGYKDNEEDTGNDKPQNGPGD